MNAHAFIDKYGIDRAKKVVKNVVFNAEYYSEKTGSYYSSNKNDSVNLKQLKRAVIEYKLLIQAKDSYETRLRHWRYASNKE